jgi:hypothetical protein
VKIIINEDLRIQSNSTPEYVIQRRKVKGSESKTPGKEYWKDVAYFGRLDHALIRVLDFLVVDCKTERASIGELATQIRAWQDGVTAAVSGLR